MYVSCVHNTCVGLCAKICMCKEFRIRSKTSPNTCMYERTSVWNFKFEKVLNSQTYGFQTYGLREN